MLFMVRMEAMEMEADMVKAKGGSRRRVDARKRKKERDVQIATGVA